MFPSRDGSDRSGKGATAATAEISALWARSVSIPRGWESRSRPTRLSKQGGVQTIHTTAHACADATWRKLIFHLTQRERYTRLSLYSADLYHQTPRSRISRSSALAAIISATRLFGSTDETTIARSGSVHHTHFDLSWNRTISLYHHASALYH